MPSASVFAADDRSRPRISLSDTLSAPPERISKDASAFIPVSPAPSLPKSELDVRRVKASIFVFTPYPSKERVSRPSETTATDSTRFAPAYSAILAADAPSNMLALRRAEFCPPEYSLSDFRARASSTVEKPSAFRLAEIDAAKPPRRESIDLSSVILRTKTAILSFSEPFAGSV